MGYPRKLSIYLKDTVVFTLELEVFLVDVPIIEFEKPRIRVSSNKKYVFALRKQWDVI